MILSDATIKKRVANGTIGIDPYADDRVQPASYDLTLDGDFKVFRQGGGNNFVIDPHEPMPRAAYSSEHYPDSVPLLMTRSTFVLGTTAERITLPDDVGARIEGKSSLARIGIAIHSTGGFIDPGFDGQITLEISSVMPHAIKLWPGMKIAQIGFYLMDQPVERPYGSDGLGSKYQGQKGATIGRYYENLEG